MSDPDRHPDHAADQDEISLKESLRRQTDESVPDTLEVHSDQVAVLKDALRPLRSPARAAAVAAGVVLIIAVVGGLISRAKRGGGAAAS